MRALVFDWLAEESVALGIVVGTGPTVSDAPKPTAIGARAAWSKQDVDAYNRTLALFNTGKDDEMWNVLRPRATLPEAPAELLSLICRLAPMPALVAEGPRLCQRALDKAATDNPVPFHRGSNWPSFTVRSAAARNPRRQCSTRTGWLRPTDGRRRSSDL